MASSKTTINHEEIKQWVEGHGGRPARVKGTGGESGGLLRVDFPGYSGEQSLEEISWEEFFETFGKNNLDFLYRDEKDSRFSKFVER